MKSIADRVLDAFPSGAYSLTALLRLMDIVETDAVPTAAVECKVQPRLLLNPSFVAAHADTPPKLLMLVMHELHHVLLGHTTLFPRATKVQNFVFDAVINGVISRMFPRVEHLAFLRDYYGDARFPHCLLAPPPGWPQATKPAPGLEALPSDFYVRAVTVHRALYSETGASYQEVYELLPKLLEQGPGGRSRVEELIDAVPLLGAHDDDAQGSELEDRSPLLFEVLRDVVEQWPQPPDPIRGRSLADVLELSAVAARRHPSNRQRLRRLIRKVAGRWGDGGRRERRLTAEVASTPLPSLARRSLVQRALGHEPLLHPGPVPWRRRVPSGERVHIYVDVSGSMESVLPALYGAVLDCRDQVEPVVHLFSTKVSDVSLADLRAGRCVSTYGTDIACVAEHMARHRVRRAVLVTDGWVGRPRSEHHETLAKARVAVAFLGSGCNEDDLRAVARHTCTLNVGETR